MVTETLHSDTARSKHYPIFLLFVYCMFWAWLGANPVDRADWWIENIIIFVFVPTLLLTYQRFRLSNTSYSLVFAFLVLHTYGSHYTYDLAPLGAYLAKFLGLQGNVYDRIVHFSFGLCLVYPARELLMRMLTIDRFWKYWIPFQSIVALSALYQIAGMFVTMLINGQTATAILGSQANQWDSTWDMTMAAVGAALCMLVTFLTALIHREPRIGSYVPQVESLESPMSKKEIERLEKQRKKQREEEERLAAKEREQIAKLEKQRRKEQEAEERIAQKAREDAEREARKLAKEEPTPPALDEPEDEPLTTKPHGKHEHSPAELLSILHGEHPPDPSRAARSKKKSRPQPKRKASKKKK